MNLKAQQASVQISARTGIRGPGQPECGRGAHQPGGRGRAQWLPPGPRSENAVAQLKEAEVRLGYTKIYAPVTGTVLVRAAREGEVVNAGQAIVTVVDFSDTWVRAAIPETDADHIGYGDTLKIRLPGGTSSSGKSVLQSGRSRLRHPARRRRRKRDIRTLVLKVRLDNPRERMCRA